MENAKAPCAMKRHGGCAALEHFQPDYAKRSFRRRLHFQSKTTLADRPIAQVNNACAMPPFFMGAHRFASAKITYCGNRPRQDGRHNRQHQSHPDSLIPRFLAFFQALTKSIIFLLCFPPLSLLGKPFNLPFHCFHLSPQAIQQHYRCNRAVIFLPRKH